MGLLTPQECGCVVGLWELAHIKANNTDTEIAQKFSKHIHTSQTTLPRRGSSQEFTEHKNNREASRDGSLRSRNKFCKLLTLLKV